MGWTIVCGADLNMRIRKSELPWIGDNLDPSTGGGTDEEHVHKLCKLFDLKVVNTHSTLVKDTFCNGTHNHLAQSPKPDHYIPDLNFI